MSLDSQLLTLAIDHPDKFVELQRMGVTAEDFEGDFRRVWEFLNRAKRQSGTVPSREVVKGRFSFLIWSRVRERDIPILVTDLRQRRKYNNFLNLLIEASRECRDPEDLDDVLSHLQSGLNGLSLRNGENPLVDVLSRSGGRLMVKELRQRREGLFQGVSTGFSTLDDITGGLQPQRMIVVIGRTGHGKSWLDLFFVAEAIMQGKKVILYPLEMSLFETVMRLYTIFSQKVFAGHHTFKNLDLTKGRINKRSLLRFLSILEERFNGQLLVSDISRLSASYTVERLEAEVETNNPFMFWVDYLTLLKGPVRERDDLVVRELSSGIKGIAMRHMVVGGCSAQVNRESVKTRAFLPRLEHISFGDSIGHDADQVISLAKRGSVMSYALVKNRLGPEISRVDCQFNVNLGVIEEMKTEEEDDN